MTPTPRSTATHFVDQVATKLPNVSFTAYDPVRDIHRIVLAGGQILKVSSFVAYTGQTPQEVADFLLREAAQ